MVNSDRLSAVCERKPLNLDNMGLTMKIRLSFCVILAFSSLFCGPSDKKTKEDVAANQYDYRVAVQNYQIGCNYLNELDSVNAIKYLKLAVEMEPENFNYNHWLGVAYSMNGQIEKAEESLTRAIEINEASTESYNCLAVLYTENGDYQKAEEYLKKVLADGSYPKPDFAYFNLGILKRKEGKLVEAVAAFQKCVKENPEFYRAYITLGNMYEEDLNYKAALHYYSLAEPGYKDDFKLYFKIGKMNYKLKRYREAKRHLSQVLILFPPPEVDAEVQGLLKLIQKMGY
ncbi:MAG: hypothetical protein CR997_01085 [Acidobacteria bacterium]|nr:MAG: hypothetical protein CR997_01085 [Acidobacteriota bacterium]